MTTDRAHAAEDEYFRNREADQRHDDALELQRVERVERAEHEASETARARQAARAAIITPHARRDARRALNRLIVAGWGEVLAFEEASRIVLAADARRNLREKAARRLVFRSDLSRAVVAFGGVPPTRASRLARGSVWARSLRRLVTGPHKGDAYAVCVRASERASAKYAHALRSSLPDDIRFGIERQYAEIELDYRELRRLRWA